MNGIETFREIKPNKLVIELVTLIGQELVRFHLSDEFQEVLKQKKNENQHSTAYCLFMTNLCNSTYYFGRENAQKGSSTIDIGVYKGATLIFVIEAKVLPTPKGTPQKPRNEYEYVYGKGAAIQRYKNMDHGVNNQDLPFSDGGVFAYVKSEDFDFWYNKINQWILDAAWDSSEQLQKVKINTSATLVSAHIRKDGSMIRLHHFWVKV
jgi:hypothetical protein